METGVGSPCIRPLLFLLLVVTLVACGSDGAQLPGPPALDGDAMLDPEIVRAVDQARERVLADRADLPARVALAMVLDANGLDEAAEEAWQAVLRATPEDPRAWYHLARVRERAGRTEEALSALAEALQRTPDYAPAHLRRGRMEMELGRLEEAESSLLRARELEPDSAGTALALGRLQLQIDRTSEAVETLSAALRRNAREPQVNGLLARAYGRLGDHGRARAHLVAEREADRSSRGDPWASEMRGHAVGLLVRMERVHRWIQQGEFERALGELDALEDRRDDLLVVEGYCKIELSQGRPGAVLTRLDRLMAPGSESYKLSIFRALALRALGREVEARQAATTAVASNPAHADSHALLGELCFDLGDAAAAVASFRAARARGDERLATLLRLGRALGQVHQLEEGEAVLAEAAELYPGAPKTWAYRSELLALLGRTEEARGALGKAQELGLEAHYVEVIHHRLEELAGLVPEVGVR